MEGTATFSESEAALRQRIKEIECLYNVGSEIRSDENVIAGLNNTTSHLVQAMQFPAIASATIYLDGKRYSDGDTPKKRTRSNISADLVIREEQRGRVEVSYSKDISFLPEERRLVEEVALRISKKVERHEMATELKRYAEKLEELVEEKTGELEASKKRYEDLFMKLPHRCSYPASMAISSKEIVPFTGCWAIPSTVPCS